MRIVCVQPPDIVRPQLPLKGFNGRELKAGRRGAVEALPRVATVEQPYAAHENLKIAFSRWIAAVVRLR